MTTDPNAMPTDDVEPTAQPPSADAADRLRNDEPHDEAGAETESPFASDGGLTDGPGTPSEPDEPARSE